MMVMKKFLVMEVEDGKEPEIYTKEDIDKAVITEWRKDLDYRIEHDKEIRKEVANEIFKKIEKKGVYSGDCDYNKYVYLTYREYEQIKKEVGV